MKNNLVVYSDGGSRGNPGDSAGGFVFLTEDEKILERSLYFGEMTNNMAEYLAFINACQEARLIEQKFTKITFYLDSLLVVKQVNGEWKIKDEKIKKLNEKAMISLSFLKIPYQVKHIPREENKDADFLVNQALDF